MKTDNIRQKNLDFYKVLLTIEMIRGRSYNISTNINSVQYFQCANARASVVYKDKHDELWPISDTESINIHCFVYILMGVFVTPQKGSSILYEVI